MYLAINCQRADIPTFKPVFRPLRHQLPCPITFTKHAPTHSTCYQPPSLSYSADHQSTLLHTISDSAPKLSTPFSQPTMSLFHTPEQLFPSITGTTYTALGLFCPLQFSCSGSSSTGVIFSINNTVHLRVVTFRITIPAQALALLANRQRVHSNAPNPKPSVSFSL